MGPSHDAAYAIGLALAATTDQPVSGKSVAAGLRKLAGGTTVLVATHDRELIRLVGRRTIRLDQGRVVEIA